MPKNTTSQFVFRNRDAIGVADASEDKEYLGDCFVDTGDIDILRDCSKPGRIVTGRTGAGKTALLMRLSEIEERVISIQPETLALPYIANSTILNFLRSVGVRLDTFFRLLWRHVLTVEILRSHYHIHSLDEKRSFWTALKVRFSNSKHRLALEYLDQWGDKYWEETEERIRGITTRLEDEIKTSLGGHLVGLAATVGAASRISSEEKTEVVARAQRVVNEVQVRQLADIIEMLDEILDDPQKRYYVVIDRLDEDWVDEQLRYRLIRALVDTAREFRKVRHAKIIVALRQDLLERVLRLTADQGLQPEKLDSVHLPLRWSRAQLAEVLDARINRLVRQRYTKKTLTHSDLLPRRVGNSSGLDYILDRTFMRPRDVILFFNCCINESRDDPKISVAALKRAEAAYSTGRLQSIAQEWITDYPNLARVSEIFKGFRSSFPLAVLTASICEDFCLQLAVEGIPQQDVLSQAAVQVAEGVAAADFFKRALLQVCYHVGLLGVKLAPYEPTTWASTQSVPLTPADISDDVHVAIHPSVWRALRIDPASNPGARA